VQDLLNALRPFPVTAGLLVCSLLGFSVVYFNAPVSWVAALTFTPFELTAAGPVFGEPGAQLWRLVTPAFLHFGWLHIAFNALWTWEFGRRIEARAGSLSTLGLFLAVAMVSNVAQYLFGGPGLFGGMSGVVYGFLGFAVVAERIYPRWALGLPPGVVVLMLGWLVACVLGVVEVLGFGAIANAAHIGGLAAGAVLAVPLAFLERYRRRL
jgi:GlpG protein